MDASEVLSPEPTLTDCFLETSEDAVYLLEAVINGTLPVVLCRPPHGEESQGFIKSGYVFVLEQNYGGIKRWTDGLAWSPSRILGEFLIYAERPKNSTKQPGETNCMFAAPRTAFTFDDLVPYPRELYGAFSRKAVERNNSLMKKTITISYQDLTYRIISYYRPRDVCNGKLLRPSMNPRFAGDIDRLYPLLSPEMKAKNDYSGVYCCQARDGNVTKRFVYKLTSLPTTDSRSPVTTSLNHRLNCIPQGLPIHYMQSESNESSPCLSSTESWESSDSSLSSPYPCYKGEFQTMNNTINF